MIFEERNFGLGSNGPDNYRHYSIEKTLKNKMKVKVTFFGVLTEAAGTNSVELEWTDSLEALKESVCQQYPKMKNYSYKIAVNETLVNGETSLSENDEIAFLPPYAGG